MSFHLTVKTQLATALLMVSKTFKTLNNETHSDRFGMTSLVIHMQIEKGQEVIF